MSSPQRNSKKPTPEIYRRRRIAALIVLVVFVALVWAGVSAVIGFINGGSDGANSADGQDQGAVVVEEGEVCPPGTVIVEATVGTADGTNQLSFAAEETPYIWFALTNSNPVDCTFNAGAKVQYFTILSGDQTIWSSKDCDRTQLEDAMMTLKAGETISSTPQPWEKVFSSSTGCGADEAPVITGGASYHLKVEVNGEISKNTQQFVLN